MKKGKFIVFEGIDGSGKATQQKLLVMWLKKHGYKVTEVDFPQYYSSFFGPLVGRYLRGEFGNNLSPYLAGMIYAGDRFEARENIKKHIAKGNIIVANRYTGSNMAHQTARVPRNEQKKFLEYLDTMEYKIFEIPREDIVIFIHVSPEVGQILVDKKGERRYVGGSKRDIHESNKNHLKAASWMYTHLSETYSHWAKVNGCDGKGKLKEPQTIHQEIISLLKKRKVL